MIAQAEANAEADKARRQLIEASNKADSVCAETEKAITEFGEQLAAEDKEKVQSHLKELRELATKAAAGDDSVTADQINNKIGETQSASLTLFQKVYEKRNADSSSQDPSSTTDSTSSTDSNSSSSSEEPKKN